MALGGHRLIRLEITLDFEGESMLPSESLLHLFGLRICLDNTRAGESMCELAIEPIAEERLFLFCSGEGVVSAGLDSSLLPSFYRIAKAFVGFRSFESEG